MKYLFFALRPKQWIKNLFIFLPLVFGKKLFIFPENYHTFLGFWLFSFSASIVYLINDIIDFKHDSQHPTKRLRPIASGKVTIKQAYSLAFILAIFTFIAAFQLNISLGYIITIYFVSNILYSIFLKNAVIIDVFCLAWFFLLRILAGGLIADIEISHWMFIMTGLLALFLGFNKRRQELKIANLKKAETREVLWKYTPYFIDQMIAVITSSVVVTYMLYTVDARTVAEFGTKRLIFSTPFVYYGIFRYLYLVHKHQSDGDPTRILLQDKKMQLNIIIWLIVCILVIYKGF